MEGGQLALERGLCCISLQSLGLQLEREARRCGQWAAAGGDSGFFFYQVGRKHSTVNPPNGQVRWT